MLTTNLRKVGGSVMLAVPPAVLDLLHLEVGATVTLEVDGHRLIIDPQVSPRYTLEELLQATDVCSSSEVEDREWVEAPPQGRELI